MYIVTFCDTMRYKYAVKRVLVVTAQLIFMALPDDLTRSEEVLRVSDVQGSAKRWTLVCVIPASWLPLAVGREFTQPRTHLMAQLCRHEFIHPSFQLHNFYHKSRGGKRSPFCALIIMVSIVQVVMCIAFAMQLSNSTFKWRLL